MEKLRKFPKFPESIPQRCLYAFGPFHVDPVKRLLLRGGEPIPPAKPAYQFLLLGIAALFFITSWLRGGQTLGMRAWRLKVERESGEALDARTGLVRFAGGLLSVAAGGLGLLWLWIDRDKLTWHDRLAGTRVVVLPKAAR